MTNVVASDDVLHTDPVPDGADDVPLSITAVCVDQHCVGQCWRPVNTELLARLIAIVAMGQSAHAARIIIDLVPAEPALNHHVLREEAKRNLRISAEQPERAEALRAHRDGVMFEVISWIAAQQSTSGAALLRDPHTKATTQGLDGLMLERTAEGEISRATIFEDKCSTHPRDKFRDEILKTFHAYHENKRAPELVAACATLMGTAGLDGTSAITAAGRVLDTRYRVYRGSVTVMRDSDTPRRRKAIFKGYDQLMDLEQNQRIAGTFVMPGQLREWFDQLAEQVISYIDQLETPDADV